MAPSFFSKFGKSPVSPSPSPSPSVPSSPPSVSSSTPRKSLPTVFVEAVSIQDDVPSDNSVAPHFTIIPPSPSVTSNSLANSSDNEAQKKEETGKTPHRSESFLRNSASTGNIRQRTVSTGSSMFPSTPAHGRFATVAGKPQDPKGSLSKNSSASSLRIDSTLGKDTTVSSVVVGDQGTKVLVDSPTSSSPPPIHQPFLHASTSNYLAPKHKDSDAASVRSTSSRNKPWNRSRSGSKPISPTKAQSKSSKRSQSSGLASAIAASGLAMAQPVAPAAELPAQFQQQNGTSTVLDRHGRKTSLVPRNNRSTASFAYSDYSGQDSGSESDSSDSDVLALTAENIPVTGFAVASNKRNADFHEQFPVIPEGDYLIEDYGCALQRDILIQGRLYISENHICFHANIFGWITDLTIPMDDILGLDKKMTAFVIPNAIQVTTRHTKYTFASFLSRDTTFDVIYNIWRLARPVGSTTGSIIGSFDVHGSTALITTDEGLKIIPKVTHCTCGKERKHYSEIALESVLPGTPEKIHNLMFASGFIKSFMIDEQKLLDLQISDWVPPSPDNPKLLARQMSYIKPLNASIGPKQTKCELRDEVVYCDFDNYVSTLTTTRTPDVPSGNVFSVKTRTCITWASSASSRVLVTTEVEWTGRSFIKGIIERSCIDGQKTYHADLDSSMRIYIQGHLSEFIPEGMDAAEAEAAQTAEIVVDGPTPSKSPEEARKEREHERNRRGLQWAYDTAEGAFNVAKQSTETAWELVKDSWDQSSSGTIPWFIIALLVISNIWTLMRVGGREEVGRKKEALRMEVREKWVQDIVTALWEELSLGRKGIGGSGAVSQPAAVVSPMEEIGSINRVLDTLEERVRNLRESLHALD